MRTRNGLGASAKLDDATTAEAMRVRKKGNFILCFSLDWRGVNKRGRGDSCFSPLRTNHLAPDGVKFESGTRCPDGSVMMTP
jgi:hypothetical protein